MHMNPQTRTIPVTTYEVEDCGNHLKAHTVTQYVAPEEAERIRREAAERAKQGIPLKMLEGY